MDIREMALKVSVLVAEKMGHEAFQTMPRTRALEIGRDAAIQVIVELIVKQEVLENKAACLQNTLEENSRLKMEIIGALTDAGGAMLADAPCAAGEIPAMVRRVVREARAKERDRCFQVAWIWAKEGPCDLLNPEGLRAALEP